MTVTTAPPKTTPSGIVRRAFFTSPPTKDVSSKPEKAKHSADHRLIVPSVSSCGSRFAGAKLVAEPTVASATMPATISRKAGIQFETPPTIWSHRPAPRPSRFRPRQNARPPRTKIVEKVRLSASVVADGPNTTRTLAAMKSSRDGKEKRVVHHHAQR